MTTAPDLLKAIGTYVGARENNDVEVPPETYHDSDRKAMIHRFDKIHPDIRPYAMMTNTCYMEYDPMSNRGVIPGIYARCIGPVIGNTVVFQDVNLNQIQLAVERSKTEIYFTHGWTRLRDFYDIGPGAWLILLFINPFVFNLKIRTITGVEMTYPVHTPPAKLMLDDDFQRGFWDAPIPLFVLPKVYSHRLEKTLTAADVASGTLTLFWNGFCQNAFPNQDAQLTFIDWLGNVWKECHLRIDSSCPATCKISGQWSDICKVHRLAADVVVKFGVTESANNRTVYFKLSPFIGVRTTLHTPSTSSERKVFYQSQQYFML